MFQRRQWHPTPVLLPGKSHGRRSLVGCSPWGRKSQTRLSDFTFTFHFSLSCIGEGNGNPLQCSCLENPRDGEKEMATHSRVLAWRIPGTGEPGGLPSMGSHRVGHNWSGAAAAAADLVSSLVFFLRDFFGLCTWESFFLLQECMTYLCDIWGGFPSAILAKNSDKIYTQWGGEGKK